MYELIYRIIIIFMILMIITRKIYKFITNRDFIIDSIKYLKFYLTHIIQTIKKYNDYEYLDSELMIAWRNYRNYYVTELKNYDKTAIIKDTGIGIDYVNIFDIH